MKHELRSPVRCIARDGDRQTGNTTSRESLPKVTANKCNQHGGGENGNLRKRESKSAQKQLPSYNSKQTYASNREGTRVKETARCVSVINKESVGTISKPSANVAVPSNSQKLDILTALLGCQSVHESGSLRTIALLKKNISANNTALPRPCSFCQVSASDTLTVVSRHPCMSWCPYAQPHMSDVGQDLDFRTVVHFGTKPNGSCQSCPKYTNPHEELDCGEFIISSETGMCLGKRLETLLVNPQDTPFTRNLPVDMGAMASASLGSHSSAGSTTNSSRWLPVPSVLDDMMTGQAHDSVLALGMSPGTVLTKLNQNQPPTASSSTILQESSSASDNPLQKPSIHSNRKQPEYTSFPWNILEELCDEPETDFSLPNDESYFDEMVDLIVRILFVMYIKESKNRCIKKPTTETGGNKFSDDPCIETLKSNFKKNCNEKTSSSLLEERWNPEQCVKDAKPLLQVKYNAPVRPSSRAASRDGKCEVRAKSEPPGNTQMPVLPKPFKYGKRKVFVQLTGEAISPKRAEKQKNRPFVSSRSPRKQSSVAQQDMKASREDKIVPDEQKHVMDTKEVIVNIEENVSVNDETYMMPTTEHNRTTMKKMKYASPNRCANKNTYAVRRGVFCGNGGPNEDSTRCTPEHTPNGSKDKRCQTWLGHLPLKAPAGDSGLTESSQSRHITQQEAVFCHNLENFKDVRSGQLTNRQQAFPKKSYGMVNLLVDSLSEIANDDTSYAIFHEKTRVDKPADSMTVKKAEASTGTHGSVGAKKGVNATKSTKLSRNRTLHYGIENTKVNEQTDERTKNRNSQGIRDKSVILLSEAKRNYPRVCEEDNVFLKDGLKLCPQSWPVENSYRVEKSRNRNDSEKHYCYNKRSTNGESGKQEASRKQMKYKGSKLKYDCSDSGDCQVSENRKVTDLSVGKKNILNRHENSSMTLNKTKYCRVTNAANKDKTESGVRAGELSKNCCTESILTDKSHIKKHREGTYAMKESFQSGGNIQYLNLPVCTQTINNKHYGEGRQLLAPTDNLLFNSKCHNKPDSQLMQFLDDGRSPKRRFQGLSWISPTEPKLYMKETLIGKDKPCELEKAQDNTRDNGDVLIQPRNDDFEHQNCLGELKCKCSHASGICKKRNLSRWHALYDADKKLIKSNRAMISSRTLNDVTWRLQASPRDACHGLNGNNCQETLAKGFITRTKTPSGHTSSCYIEKIEDTLLEGREPKLAAKHFRYQHVGDAVLPGSVTQSAGCDILSALRQACAENIMSPTDRSLNTANLCMAQSRHNRPPLERNACLSRSFDNSDVSGNDSRFSCMYSSFDQSINVEMGNLIMSKDANIRKSHSDSTYLTDVYHTLSTPVTDAYISVAKETSHKGHKDDKIIGWKCNRDNESNFVNHNIPRDNQNYSGLPSSFMERMPWAHRWKRVLATNVQDEPLDLSRKERHNSPSEVAHTGLLRHNFLQDLAPTATYPAWFPLQSSPLNLSTK